MAEQFADDIIEELIARLGKGESLAAICRDKRMPARFTVQRWMRADDELASRILDAREIGFHDRAERAVEAVRKCKDPIKARVVFDAERWYLGKLSLAFADKPVVVGAVINVDADNAYRAVAGALEVAAGRIASRATNTRPVVVASEAGPDHAAGGLEHLAGSVRPGVGEDEAGGE